MSSQSHRFVHNFRLLLGSILLVITLTHCQSETDAALNDPALAEGQQLAKQHCSTCHQFPAPALLDKETWVKHVLPVMATNLGLEVYPGEQYYAGAGAAISFSDWEKLISYYRTLAPETLDAADKPTAAVTDWSIFTPDKPVVATNQTAMTTLVAIDTISHSLYSSDALRNNLTRWSLSLQPTLFRQLNSAAVSATFFRDNRGHEQGLFATLGTMRAEDVSRGELIELNLSDGSGADSLLLAKELPRPLQPVAADFDNDGRMDWAVCGFGHTRGGLYWLKQTANHQFIKRPIREVPGAIQATVSDFNADGWPDLMVLFAHADEGIWLFLNDKKGGFAEQKLLGFPSVYGSTSFQLADINQDGRLDILYTCGDNIDYSQILKPYHGLYIFLNQGGFRYKQAYFYPINGCTKAMAADFDQDGDLDIATIAFFADFKNNPAESCLIFEQRKPLDFLPHAMPISTHGRWICMDVNDLDQDGDADIVLGNFSKSFVIQKDFSPPWNTHLPLLVLKNKTHP